MIHVHNNDPAQGLVCSHAVTSDQLIAFGARAPMPEQSPGQDGANGGEDWQEGHGGAWEPRTGNRAIHRAWMSGHVRICTLDPRETRVDAMVEIEAIRARGVAALPFWEAIVQR